MVLLFGWNQKIKDNFALASPSTSMARIQAPPAPGGVGGGAYIRRGDVTEGFLGFDFGGLICGGAYFWNFTVPRQ